MESNIKGLVAAGHEMASELKAECGAVDMRSVAKLISDLATQLEVQLVRANALAAENAGMDAFFDALLSIAWQGGSADGAEIQDLALKHGLLRQEVYSADEHETLVDDPGNFEDGDPVYFRIETTATNAFLAEIERKAIRKFINSIEHILRDKLSPYDTEEMLEAMRIFLEEQSGEQK